MKIKNLDYSGFDLSDENNFMEFEFIINLSLNLRLPYKRLYLKDCSINDEVFPKLFRALISAQSKYQEKDRLSYLDISYNHYDLEKNYEYILKLGSFFHVVDLFVESPGEYSQEPGGIIGGLLESQEYSIAHPIIKRSRSLELPEKENDEAVESLGRSFGDFLN